jgi:hypothetical protein
LIGVGFGYCLPVGLPFLLEQLKDLLNTLRNKKQMTERNLTKQLQYYVYNDPEYGEDIENISYPALIEIIDDLYDKIETLERDNQLLKSYAWEV